VVSRLAVLRLGRICCFLSACLITTVLSAQTEFKVESPLPHQVFQRLGFQPREAHVHATGGPALGFANIPVVIQSTSPLQSVAWRLVVPGKDQGAEWQSVMLSSQPENRWQAEIRLPAGWHRLELKIGEQVRLVEPVGVGELFIVAGQSYADGANDELLKVQDPAGRVSALNLAKNTWAVAHDPQPNKADGGTLWPALGDLLVRVLDVPVGFVNVAVGGTSSRQWLPGTPLYQGLEDAGKRIGRFRAVLWQQGESDVIEKVSTETYIRNIQTIRSSVVKAWGYDAIWLPAKSTLHPTVYNDTVHEGQIRTAIDRLQQLPGFRPGPDTDILGGENRGAIGTRRHFTGVGQRNAALMWFAAVLNEIETTGPADAKVLKVERLPSGRRFGIWGDKPAKPAPTILLFAADLKQFAEQAVYSDIGRPMEKQGWLVVALDSPCHGEDVKEGEAAQLNGWPSRLEKQDDLVAPFVVRVKELIDHLVKEGYSDETRLAVAGTSRGGFLALHVAAAEPRFKAVAAFAPVTDLRALNEFKGHEELAAVDQVSAIHLADKLAGRPVWMNIGNYDERVSTDDALAFIQAVAKAGAKVRKNPTVALPIECILAESAGHSIPPNSHVPAAAFILKHVAP